MAGSTELTALVEKAAPLLGSVLGGPAGGIVGSLVATLFGGDPTKPDELVDKINADPDARAKLLTLQYQHQEFLQTQLLEKYKEHIADMADARDRQLAMAKLGFHEWVMPILAILSMVQFWAYIIVCKFLNSSIDVTILTDLFAMAFMAFTFYFGSSQGEQRRWTNSVSQKR